MSIGYYIRLEENCKTNNWVRIKYANSAVSVVAELAWQVDARDLRLMQIPVIDVRVFFICNS